MIRSVTSTLVLILTISGLALAQQAYPSQVNQADSPWAVSVVHMVDLQKMIKRMRERGEDRIGVPASGPQYIYNVATGLVLDNEGHIVTRLANLDPQDSNQLISIITRDGTNIPARLVGVDLATGFAILEAASLKVDLTGVASVDKITSGIPVKILSTDIAQRAAPSENGTKVYLSPLITSAQGRIGSASVYSQARGALTLFSNSLLSRNDSSVVTTLTNQVVGIAQYAGFGRAYLFPFAFIRDTVAKRVIDKKGNVSAGWLGAKGDSVAQLPDGEIGALGVTGKTGVIVREIVPDSPAAKAGMMPNDVIIGVDNFEIAGAADLSALLMTSPEGRKVKLRTIRNRQPLELDVMLGARPNGEMVYSTLFIEQRWESSITPRNQLDVRLEELKTQFRRYQSMARSRERDEALKEIDLEIRQINDALRAVGPGGSNQPLTSTGDRRPGYPDVGFTTSGKGEIFKFGIIVRDLTPQLANYFQVKGGILVLSVMKDSPAARSGMKAGDIIEGTEKQSPLSATQLEQLLSTEQGAISLKIVREKKPSVMTINHRQQ